VLRKDFIIDEYQVYQSRYLGADAILLIVRLLSDYDLARFIRLAGDLKMTALVEVHDEQEVIRAKNAGAQCIGVNNRDLTTLKTDINTCLRLRTLLPEYCVTVAESGVYTRKDMLRIEAAGFHAVLIGHALARAGDVQETMNDLQGRLHEDIR
jgi:indole-3-glycerol phosphate synthase